MHYEIVTLQEKTVAGLSARTSNADEKMNIVIGGLWERFYHEGIYASIPGQINEKTLGIYTDYTGKEREGYTVLAACEVCEAPDNAQLAVRKIPAGRYAKFMAKGKLPAAAAQAWQEIWKMDLPRAFICDFEEYQNSDSDHAEIHIYIGLKEEGIAE